MSRLDFGRDVELEIIFQSFVQSWNDVKITEAAVRTEHGVAEDFNFGKK